MERVVVVGGGYGGTKVAGLVDDVAEVVLVEPRDSFVHASAALRGAVDPAWEEHIFVPYDRLLRRGQVVRQRVERAIPGQVKLADGSTLETDYLVLATGTRYPFPAKYIETETTVAHARLARMREGLSRAQRVLVVGAGPVGLELVGELREAYPQLAITVVDQAEDALTSEDFDPRLRSSVREQLSGVDFLFGSRLGYLPPVDVGVLDPFAVETEAGDRIEAQMWFRCYGNRVDSDYLAGDLATVRNGLGEVRVGPTMQVQGVPTVFAIGDLTDLPEAKRASAARAHADVAAANLRELIAGRPASVLHEPAPRLIVLPLGTRGGASQLTGPDGETVVLGPEETRRIKDEDLFSTEMAELLSQGRAWPDRWPRAV